MYLNIGLKKKMVAARTTIEEGESGSPARRECSDSLYQHVDSPRPAFCPHLRETPIGLNHAILILGLGSQKHCHRVGGLVCPSLAFDSSPPFAILVILTLPTPKQNYLEVRNF